MAMTSNAPVIDGEYDVVVVGAGNGGLAAGLMLAVKGIRPLILEQHNLPGGFATSFVRGRFEFETSLHELNGIGTAANMGGVRRFLEAECGVNVDWVSVPEAYRIVLTDKGFNARLPFGVEDFIDAICKEAPESREQVTRYIRFCQSVHDSFGLLGRYAAKPGGSAADFLDFLKKADNPISEVADAARKVINIVKTVPCTVDEVTATFGLPEKVIDMLYPYWCYIGIPTSRMSFPIWAGMLIDYLECGAYVPRMRSHEMSVAIENRIRELGGRVEYNTRVEHIDVRRGCVTGVETSRGDRIRTRCVISNSSPTQTFNNLVSPQSEVPPEARRIVNARRHGGAGFVVYLGLDASPQELGIDDYGYFISKNMNTDEVYDSMTRLALTNMQATTCLNNTVPDCSPPGTTILSMTTLYTPEVWRNVTPEEYHATKNRIADEMVTQFDDALGTDIRSHIEEVEIATPATFARYACSWNGVIYGYELDPWDGIIPRMVSRKTENYIDGLIFSGGFASHGHGYSSSLNSGRTAALSATAYLRGK